MLSFPVTNLEIPQADTQLPVMDSTVLIITLDYWSPCAKAPLKLGQYIQRNKVPIIAIVWEVYPPAQADFSEAKLAFVFSIEKK